MLADLAHRMAAEILVEIAQQGLAEVFVHRLPKQTEKMRCGNEAKGLYAVAVQRTPQSLAHQPCKRDVGGFARAVFGLKAMGAVAAMVMSAVQRRLALTHTFVPLSLALPCCCCGCCYYCHYHYHYHYDDYYY